jgi:fermentation-respiration switch protein FrsA (DUF1100 family)
VRPPGCDGSTAGAGCAGGDAGHRREPHRVRGVQPRRHAGRLLPPEADPARYLDRFAPRPLLFVNATGDATVPRQAAQALFDAALEPKQMLWFDGSHAKLPGEALKAMWLFLKRHLDHD